MAFQRGKEHSRDIEEGVLGHPMVQNFWEEHKGEKQEILLSLRETLEGFRKTNPRICPNRTDL